MKAIPPDILSRFHGILKQRAIPMHFHQEYRKWLCYFLDFHAKYPLSPERAEQVKLFSDKLRSKGRTPAQIEQAADAVSLFYASQRFALQTCPASSDAVSSAAVQLAAEKSHAHIPPYAGCSAMMNPIWCANFTSRQLRQVLLHGEAGGLTIGVV